MLEILRADRGRHVSWCDTWTILLAERLVCLEADARIATASAKTDGSYAEHAAEPAPAANSWQHESCNAVAPPVAAEAWTNAAMEDSYLLAFVLLSAVRGVACAFAVAVVISPNIVRMAFYLVLSLAATAGLFFLAGADFVGAMQIMIYVGGTLVLLVFGVMLTSQGPLHLNEDQQRELGWPAVVGGCLWPVLGHCRPAAYPSWRGLSIDQANALKSPLQPTATRLGMGLFGVRGR